MRFLPPGNYVSPDNSTTLSEVEIINTCIIRVSVCVGYGIVGPFKWPRRNRPGSRSIRGDRPSDHTQTPYTSSWPLLYAHHARENGNLFLMLIRDDHEARRLDR